MPGRRSEPTVLSLTGRLLQHVVQVCCARPALTVLVAFAFAALGVGYAAHSLTLETSKFHLLPLHQRYATLYKDYAEDFGQLEDIVVVVQSADVETFHGLRGPPGRSPPPGRPRDGRASAIGSTPAASKPTHCCTYRSTHCETPSTRLPATKNCSPTSLPLRHSPG